ncbi:MAG: ribosomal protein S18-alanine N-acetyltransferase [Chloroflexi bacterium]|nr:ribosomal protein S18-alanine N-acetyltransferase [Chloroflexota bacterium]
MSHYVRMMFKEDVAQVTEIDREAFPTQLPPANYQHELQNRLARHIVACDEEKLLAPPEVKAQPTSAGLASRIIRQLFHHQRSSGDELPPSKRHYVIGFVGLWVIADEAHVTAIAVREAYRRQGAGELLLISAIDLATELGTRVLTLEVRASNTGAQSLYIKYGFNKVGVRRGYYIDNREDGIVMSTPDITLATFQQRYQQLKQAHSQKYGIATYRIVR